MGAMSPAASPPMTLGALFDALAAGRAQAPALLHAGHSVSYATLDEESRRVAGGLAGLGIAPGDVVAIWMPGTPEWLVAALACARLGAGVLALNTRFRSAELDELLARSGAKAIVLAPDFPGLPFSEILAGCDPEALGRVEAVIACDGAMKPVHGKRAVGFDDLRRAAPLVEDRGRPEAPWMIFTTSSTTSRPKLALHLHRDMLAHALDVDRAFGYGERTILYAGLPLSGTFGLAQALATLAAGGTAVLHPVFEAEEAARLIAGHRVTDFNATDEMIHRILEAAPGERPFPALRGCGYAAFSPALVDLAERAQFRGVTLFGLYGSSEVQALYALQPLALEPALRRRPGGFPVAPEAAFRIVDPESGAELPDGASGELLLKGPSLMREYLGNDGATRRSFTADGFFRSGDLAHRAPDGSFVFEARMGDVLRLGGYLVSPSEIEAYLQRHPAIEGAQVVGVNVEGMLRAVGFVTLRQGAAFEADEVRRFCAAGLARFKVPAAVFPIDAFPTTQSANGVKIQKVKLREMAEASLSPTGRGDTAPQHCSEPG
jgi:fatty-acyl-CoA synthase